MNVTSVTAADGDAVAANLAAIRARVEAAARAAGRAPSTVQLLPVTKTQPSSRLRSAAAAGYRRFGENRVQELVAKQAELSDLDLAWVLIGHLQSNKAGPAVRLASQIQSLDSLGLAATLQHHCERYERQLDVLIEVNTSAEAAKFGLDPAAVAQFTTALRAYDRLHPRGLMTVARPGPDSVVAPCFARLAQLQVALRDRDGSGWDELSMGMTNDFELAIAYGATCVRVGTAIFGSRDLRPQAGV